ncbi:hypothetical protein DFH08DRAFT_823079 [Mycena albidolilacea]|uniref:Uncharacterized protein n=1 Tax=Mycena albidolilacea TaxID=1033008 RepID=A0AAD6Z7F8_9AGAR|nr:hypothetical protein DFH08DRAFT_823079 [Mycena albidolilacea]
MDFEEAQLAVFSHEELGVITELEVIMPQWTQYNHFVYFWHSHTFTFLACLQLSVLADNLYGPFCLAGIVNNLYNAPTKKNRATDLKIKPIIPYFSLPVECLPSSPKPPDADAHTRVSTLERQPARPVEITRTSSARRLCSVCSRKNTQCAAIAGCGRARETTTPPLDPSEARRISTGATTCWRFKAELAGTCQMQTFEQCEPESTSRTSG